MAVRVSYPEHRVSEGPATTRISREVAGELLQSPGAA